jgi:hypothetical protein
MRRRLALTLSLAALSAAGSGAESGRGCRGRLGLDTSLRANDPIVARNNSWRTNRLPNTQ